MRVCVPGAFGDFSERMCSTLKEYARNMLVLTTLGNPWSQPYTAVAPAREGAHIALPQSL